MPKIDIATLAVRRGSAYPAEFQGLVAGRESLRLGPAGGLTQFGVNIVRLKPGAASSARHWHEQEDELVYMLEGELILVENDGETVMRPGDAAAFKAGVANGHHLINRTQKDGLFLVVGTCAPRERAHYPDNDLVFTREDGRLQYTRKSGEPYPPAPAT